jgi:prephenate dehydrogenase
MPPLAQERIGIVGLGAIGGSLALALRDQAPVLAWSRDPADCHAASAAGIPVCRGEGSTWLDDMAGSTVVIIAVPLGQVAPVARELQARLPDECLLLHSSGLHRRDALGLSEQEFQRVLGTHPLAGSERSGFGAADREMFRGATVRAEARATEGDRHRIEMLWRGAGVARFVWGEAAAHDELMSWVSHLPQLTATALAAVLAQRGVSTGDIGPGAGGTTRLAASDPGVWVPVLRRSPRETVEALRRLTSMLDALRAALESHDGASLTQIWEQARTWRSGAEDQG